MSIFKETRLPFGGFQAQFEDADYIVFGAPIGGTATYREGCEAAPEKVRIANANIETLNIFNFQDIAELLVHDLGDLFFENMKDEKNLQKQLDVVRKTTKRIFQQKKYPVIIGGEHNILIGDSKSVPQGSTLLVLDAHADLRKDFEGEYLSHACAVRRAIETGRFEDVILYGVRAISMEEKRLIEKQQIKVFWAKDIHKMTLNEIEATADKISKKKNIFLSVDMDVFDPSYAPGVGNPEPMGLRTEQVLHFVNKIAPATIGLEVSEFNPSYDVAEITAFLTARLIHTVITTNFHFRFQK